MKNKTFFAQFFENAQKVLPFQKNIVSLQN